MSFTLVANLMGLPTTEKEMQEWRETQELPYRDEKGYIQRCPQCGRRTSLEPGKFWLTGCCNSLVAVDVDYSMACRHVAMNLPMQNNSTVSRYFDLMFTDGDRVHGWYSTHTKKVVQYG